jgi:hypothetical protein
MKALVSPIHGYTIESYRVGNKDVPDRYLVVNRKDIVIGLLEKYRSTRTDTHPWKAYQIINGHAKFIGSYYEDGLVFNDGKIKFGGLKAAVEAITRKP